MVSTLSASAKGATFLILIQVGSRIATFAINQVLLRFLSPALLGASVQLELYSLSVLFFARESLRVTLQRHVGPIQAAVNAAYVPLILGVPLASVLGYAYLRTSLPAIEYAQQSLMLFALATLLELLSEPGFAVVQQAMAYSARARAEMLATFARCVATLSLVIWSSRMGFDTGLLPFAIGQLTYASVLAAAYTNSAAPLAKAGSATLVPQKIGRQPKFKNDEYIAGLVSRSLYRISIPIYLQSIFKYTLTQSDGWIIIAVASLEDQGAYALASNYGSLIARVLFQPIEETSRNLFSKLCAPVDDSSKKHSINKVTQATKKAKSTSSDSTPVPSRNDNLAAARDILMLNLRLYGLLSLLALSLGPFLARPFLTLVAGSRWTQTGGAADVLVAYCYYVPFLAFNGILEAFVASVADGSALSRQSAWMVVAFAASSGAVLLFVGRMNLGGVGLVWANCVNMAFRVAWCSMFTPGWFHERGVALSLSRSMPSFVSVAAAIMAWAVLAQANFDRVTIVGHPLLNELLIKCAVAVALLAIIGTAEQNFFRQFLSIAQRREQAKPDTAKK